MKAETMILLRAVHDMSFLPFRSLVDGERFKPLERGVEILGPSEDGEDKGLPALRRRCEEFLEPRGHDEDVMHERDALGRQLEVCEPGVVAERGFVAAIQAADRGERNVGHHADGCHRPGGILALESLSESAVGRRVENHVSGVGVELELEVFSVGRGHDDPAKPK